VSEELILASGLSLTRNDALAPFPHVADEDSLRSIVERVERAVSQDGSPGEWQTTRLEDLSPSTRSYLVERGLMTPAFAQAEGSHRAFALYGSGQASVQVNGQDHILMLGSRPGENLSALWGTLNYVDDVIENQVSYAFDERYGYLAARPDQAGTGMKAFVTLHLPALMVTGRLGSLAVQLLGQGLTLTPLWGGAGGLFQVSNKGGLGIGELPITEAVRAASGQIAEKERAVRKKLLRENPARVRDYIGRALGVAQQAWMVGVEEALGLISAIQSGIDMRVVELPAMTPLAALRLMQRVQPGHLAVEQGSGIPGGTDDNQLDQVRARILRSSFAQASVRDRRR
jgi:protein arginine kinase